MIEPTRAQLSFAEGLIQEEVGPLWEEWMREVDQVLADRALVQIVYEALARGWPRTMQRITKIAGRAGTKLRDRSRAVGYQVRQIARASRSRVAQQGQERLKISYRKLLYHTARVVGQAKRFAQQIATGRKRARGPLEQLRLEAHQAYLQRMWPATGSVDTTFSLRPPISHN